MTRVAPVSSVLFYFAFMLLTGCGTSSSEQQEFPADSAAIARGRELFSQNCIACHSMDQDGIGPALGGLTSEVSAAWLGKFIRNPNAVITSGDPRATQLFDRYKTIMPSYAHYPDEDINGLVAYLHTQQQKVVRNTTSAGGEIPLADPIPDPIEKSDLVIPMELVVQMPVISTEKQQARITKFDSHPITREMMVLDLRGQLYRLRHNEPEVYMDIAALMPRFIHKPGHATGFGSFAFHPEFPANGLLYTGHTEPAGSAPADFAYEDSIKVTLQWVLSEWKTAAPRDFPFEGTRRELLRINMVNQSHGMQEIVFNPLATRNSEDYGLMYVGIGDGGSAEGKALHLTDGPAAIWGSIIRIDPAGRNSANGQYGIPAINPFAGRAGARGEIFAHGFRNPHRITWTSDGKMLSSNIGQHQVEELNLILPGRDYGWPMREGTFRINLLESTRHLFPISPDEPEEFTYPVSQYDHDEGNAIIGGYEYTGKAIPVLKGKYLFADMVNGRLFYAETKDLRDGNEVPPIEWQISFQGKPTSFRQLCGDERLSLRFGRDHLGEIYLSSMIDGKVYKLVNLK